MKYFWNHRNSFKTKIKNAKKIFLALDYDGTLSTIVKNPKQAFLSSQTRTLLKQLCKTPHLQLAIVTGRSMQDIQKLVGIQDIIYIANHGFEISANTKTWIHPQAKKSIPLLNQALLELHERLNAIPGILIENKKVTASIHYRKTPSRLTKKIQMEINKILSNHPKIFKKTDGKKVFEIRPNINWDKGQALKKVLRKKYSSKNQPLTLFLGDDQTDEDVFRMLTQKDLGIRVGYASTSHADLYVRNTPEVSRLLKLSKEALTSN